MRGTLAERFWPKVDVRGPDECWPWTAGTVRGGYGDIWLSSSNKNARAHRVSFYLTHGRWPEPFCLHKCDNPPCCNPACLFEGARADNSADMVMKGRADRPRGEKNPRAKLTTEDIILMRDLYSDGVPPLDLAIYFGVVRDTIYPIVHRSKWSHIPPNQPQTNRRTQ